MTTTKINNLVEMATKSSSEILSNNGTNSNFAKIGLYMWIASFTRTATGDLPEFGEIVIEDGEDYVDAMDKMNMFDCNEEREAFELANRCELNQVEYLIRENA